MDPAKEAARTAILAELAERTRFHTDRVNNDSSHFVPYSCLTPQGQVNNTRVGRLRESEVRCPLTKGAPLFEHDSYEQYALGMTLSMEDAIRLRQRFKTEVLGIPAEFEANVWESEMHKVDLALDELWALWQKDPAHPKLEWLVPAWKQRAV